MSVVDQPKQSREERIAAMRARCEAAVGAPCSAGCTRGCARNRQALASRDLRIFKAETKRLALTASVERRQASLASKELERLAAYRIQIRTKAPKNRKGKFSKDETAIEQWRTTVLFILGRTKEQIALELYGAEETRVGAVNKIITTQRLTDVRAKRPVDRLIELDRAPAKGVAVGEVAHYAAKFNRQMLDAFLHRRGIVPEHQVQEERSRAVTRLVNANASALTAAAQSGEIREWNLLAGYRLQQEQAKVPGGHIGGMDLSGITVDGGIGDAHAKAMRGMVAAERMAEARRAILDAYRIQMSGPVRLALVEHVVIRDLPLASFVFPPWMVERPAKFLNDSLEPLAHHFSLTPAGIMPVKPTREDWARWNAAMASQDGRRRRLFGG